MWNSVLGLARECYLGLPQLSPLLAPVRKKLPFAFDWQQLKLIVPILGREPPSLRTLTFIYCVSFLVVAAIWYIRRDSLQAKYQEVYATYSEAARRYRLHNWSTNAFIDLNSSQASTELLPHVGSRALADAILNALRSIELPLLSPRASGALTLEVSTQSPQTTKIQQLSPDSFLLYETVMTNQTLFDPLLHRASRLCRVAISIPYASATNGQPGKRSNGLTNTQGSQVLIISGLIRSGSQAVSPILLEFPTHGRSTADAPTRISYDINLVTPQ